MGFLTVDPVVRKMEGLQADSIVRLQAVLEHVLKQAALSGHLYLQAGEAVQQAGILLGRLQTPVEEKKIRDAGNRMVKEGRLKAFDGGIYLKRIIGMKQWLQKRQCAFWRQISLKQM